MVSGRRLNKAWSSQRLSFNLLWALLLRCVHFGKIRRAPHYDFCPLYFNKKVLKGSLLSNSAREKILQVKLSFLLWLKKKIACLVSMGKMEKQRIPQGQLGIANTGYSTNTQPITAADKDAEQQWRQKKREDSARNRGEHSENHVCWLPTLGKRAFGCRW